MTTYRATLKLHTAFGTPLAGDTLFGQLCWTAREHLGEAELERLLKGYTSDNPWLVVSDGFPSGYLPKPNVPASLVSANFVGANSFAHENTAIVGATDSHNAIENRSNTTILPGLSPSGESSQFEPTAYLTLAPCAPQGLGFDGDKSYWRVITRFGRHGNLHGLSSKPFKNPVLLAATAAVFVPQDAYTPSQFIGQGLGGDGQLSKIEPATVQQGYAPVVGIRMEV